MFILVFNALRFMHGPSHSEEREFFFTPFLNDDIKDLDSHSHDILFNCNGFITSPRYQMQFICSFSFSGEGWPNVESIRLPAP